jgi:hypothetical protein
MGRRQAGGSVDDLNRDVVGLPARVAGCQAAQPAADDEGVAV